MKILKKQNTLMNSVEAYSTCYYGCVCFASNCTCYCNAGTAASNTVDNMRMADLQDHNFIYNYSKVDVNK